METEMITLVATYEVGSTSALDLSFVVHPNPEDDYEDEEDCDVVHLSCPDLPRCHLCHLCGACDRCGLCECECRSCKLTYDYSDGRLTMCYAHKCRIAHCTRPARPHLNDYCAGHWSQPCTYTRRSEIDNPQECSCGQEARVRGLCFRCFAFPNPN